MFQSLKVKTAVLKIPEYPFTKAHQLNLKPIKVLLLIKAFRIDPWYLKVHFIFAKKSLNVYFLASCFQHYIFWYLLVSALHLQHFYHHILILSIPSTRNPNFPSRFYSNITCHVFSKE